MMHSNSRIDDEAWNYAKSLDFLFFDYELHFLFKKHLCLNTREQELEPVFRLL